jgi:hypothetical protein
MPMRIAEDECDQLEVASESGASVALHAMLASGAGLLGLIGWLMTL